MRALLLVAIAVLTLTQAGHAQRPALDASFGSAGKPWRANAAGLWQIVHGGRIRLGAGPRLNHFGGDAGTYRTHDPRPTGLPSRVRLEPSVWSLNLMVSAELRVPGPFEVGANLDLAGVAIGESRAAGAERLRPARGSLFLYGDRDRGSLNSEYYLSLLLGRGLRVRAGASHYVTGYRVTGGPVRPRYLRFDTVPFLAVRWGS